MTACLITILIEYIIIAFFVWQKTSANPSSNNTKFEQIYFACIWPLTGLLYIGYFINNWKRILKKEKYEEDINKI